MTKKEVVEVESIMGDKCQENKELHKKKKIDEEKKIPSLSSSNEALQSKSAPLAPTCQSLSNSCLRNSAFNPANGQSQSPTMFPTRLLQATLVQQSQFPVYAWPQIPYSLMQISIPQTPMILSYPNLRNFLI